MATLQSPGVQVTIIDESFYTPSAPGTVPLIFVASASNKTNPSGVTAVGTQPANAGQVFLVTSQRDLTDTFGTPQFYTDQSGNPVHGGELNEYGLQAAYSLLGVSSAAYVVRAPIDLSQLSASPGTPAGTPVDGTYWVDTTDSLYGIFEWNQSSGVFNTITPLIIDDSNSSVSFDTNNLAPKSSFGLIGQYCVVLNQVAKSEIYIFYKNKDAKWVKVGSQTEQSFANNANTSTFVSTSWATSWPIVVGTGTPSGIVVTTSTELLINGSPISLSTGDTINKIAKTINNSLHKDVVSGGGIGAKPVNGSLGIYVDSAINRSITIRGTQDILTALGISPGVYNAPVVFVGPHTQYPDFSEDASGSVYLKTTSPNAGAYWIIKQWSSTANAFNFIKSPVQLDVSDATYSFDKTGGGANIPVGTLFVESNFNHGNNLTPASTVFADYKIYRRNAVNPTSITSNAKSTTVSFGTSTVSFVIESTIPGVLGYASTATVNISTATDGINQLVQSINNSGVANVSATLNEIVAGSSYSVTISHTTGGEIRFTDTENILGTAGFVADTTPNFYSLNSEIEPSNATYRASNWKPLTFDATPVAPSTLPKNGTLWYDAITDQVDIMVHDGSTWRGYRNIFPATDPKGPIVSSSQPTTQNDGLTALANGDIWISLANGVDTYGQYIYVYNGNLLQWVLQDPTDQTSTTGWVFADARWAASGSETLPEKIQNLLTSDYLDPDAPDPTEYPRGMRLWNLRRSGFNIKKYEVGYIDINANNGLNLRYQSEDLSSYNTNRWVSVSPNNANGSGTFGRYAQRAFVVASLKSTIDGNQTVRDTDTLIFNLIATPGYPEAIQNMITLNTDRSLTAFVVGDTSMRLAPTGTALQAYGLNSNGAFDNGEVGLVSYDSNTAVFYPSGYTNDLAGNYIVVPPSHMMLRTIAVSDQKSYPWFAPAGIRRGVVDNVTSVGYLSNGEFLTTALPEPIRNVMSKVKINPIATITGAGIINFGQYTRANAASSIDRINVSRLVAHLRRQLNVLARPFLFEPNDKITRDEIKNAVQKLLLELVGQRALYDFIVVCDSSNNTPARIDRSELWVDVAIEPVKAVEFIYIPVRLVNTGAIKAGTYTLA